MAEDRGKEFQIGLAMSGAVSAGAYTAGVFDFLIQALDEWEKARKGPDAGKIPNHRVGLKVMSGGLRRRDYCGDRRCRPRRCEARTSAFRPAEAGPFRPRRAGKGIKCYLPRLYEIWVEKPGLVAEGNEQSDFLQTSDLDGPPD